jgi:hypothetical protein
MADEGESSAWSFGWPTKIAAFFRLDREEKTLQTDEVFLYRRLTTFLWWFGGFTRPEMGDRLRERIVGERRETLRDFTTVWTPAWYTGAAEGCELLDRGWTDPSAVIGLIRKLIGRSGWAAFWSGMAWCTESLVHQVTWHNRIEVQIVLRAEMDLGFNLMWYALLYRIKSKV